MRCEVEPADNVKLAEAIEKEWVQTWPVKNGFVATFQQQKEGNWKKDAVENEKNNRVKPRCFVILGIFKYIWLLF